jgi:hypothetical protein
MTGTTYALVSGDPMAPSDSDLIACTVDLPIGQQPIPNCAAYGWRCLTGSRLTNLWGRLAYRYEIEG